MFNQTLKDIQNIYREVGGNDVSVDDFKQLCKRSWEEEYDYLCIDRSKKGDRGKYCNCNVSKNTYFEKTLKTKAFCLTWKLYSIKNRDDMEKLNKLVSLQSQIKASKLK